ncbi:hypothetical protein RchiOBHm_Chr3g0460251 [Rosa chinensis]|uniref:Protein kinase domain-containing protein n=1 Tax=Rosa chinensis TaxID=74649 RepID=A0A2P6R8B3_ROSCH|nr:hypothetical protein RchiOBHm_Chr3g0460251 [Rosa chinensis]
MLTYDSAQRITARKVMEHPYFNQDGFEIEVAVLKILWECNWDTGLSLVPSHLEIVSSVTEMEMVNTG